MDSVIGEGASIDMKKLNAQDGGGNCSVSRMLNYHAQFLGLIPRSAEVQSNIFPSGGKRDQGN